MLNVAQEKIVNKITELLRHVAAPWCFKCRARMKANGRGWYCNNRECYPDNPEAPWCLSCQIEMGAYGYSRTRAHRWMCNSCTRTLSSVYLGTYDYGFQKRQIRKPEKYQQAVDLFRQGYSVRKVAVKLNIQPMTAMRYRDLGIKEEVRCPCGGDARHQGWCRWRYQQSPRRQEFMERWHSKAV